MKASFGAMDIFLTFLSGLSRIFRSSSGVFRPDFEAPEPPEPELPVLNDDFRLPSEVWLVSGIPGKTNGEDTKMLINISVLESFSAIMEIKFQIESTKTLVK